MDHIPQPRNPVHPPVKIPLFCATEYSGAPFLQHLRDVGTTSSDVVSLCKDRSSHGELNALVQQWGFFGLMSEIFGRTIRIDEFTESGIDKERYISTKTLPKCVSEWIEWSGTLSSHEKESKSNHMEDCVSELHRLLLEIFFNSGDTVDTIDTRLVLSIAVLVEHLEAAKALAYRENQSDTSANDVFTKPKSRIGIMQGIEFVERRMLSDGWCPHEVATLQKNTSCAELYFISNLERPGPNKDHAEFRCTERQCYAYQVRAKAYSRKHTTPECFCSDIFASEQELSEILREEGEPIPLIMPFAVQQYKNGAQCVQLTSSKLDDNYVAISHVWSDGLGNENQNAIPMCQFERLSELVTECDGSPKAFWLDTLCFPLEPPDLYELAMIRMRSTYEDAWKVLVLDSYLLNQPRLGMSENEMVARIRCSPWSRRLWTLQEGALPASLAFQFSDSAVDLSSFSKKRYEKLEEPGLEFFQSSWDAFYELRAVEWDFYGGTLGPKPRSTRTTGLYNMHSAKIALTFRSTSVWEDEALCLSALLNLDVKQLLACPVAERMKPIWAEQGAISPSVIFWTDPKLNAPGFRWASSTLLGGKVPPVSNYLPGVPWAELTESGLMVTYPGIILSCAQRPLQRSFHFQDEEGSCFQVLYSEDKTGEWIDKSITKIDPWPNDADQTTCLAIVVPRTLDAMYEPSAVLVLVEQMGGEVIRARWLYSAALVRVEGSEEEDVTEHIDTDREAEALGLGTVAEKHNAATGQAQTSEAISDEDGIEDKDDVSSNSSNVTETSWDRYERLRDVPHSTRQFLCVCKAQWVVRGRHTKPDQVWCID